MDWIRRWLIDSYIKREEWEKAKLDMSGYRDPIKGKRKEVNQEDLKVRENKRRKVLELNKIKREDTFGKKGKKMI